MGDEQGCGARPAGWTANSGARGLTCMVCAELLPSAHISKVS